MNTTPRLGLPFLSVGQAQKELYHNEALQRLDMVVSAAVEEPPRVSPPPAPKTGNCYIVASGATDEWTEKDNALAGFTDGGWRYVEPAEGMSAWVRSTDCWAVFKSGRWELGTLCGSSLTIGGQQVVGGRAAAIADPTGGGTIDAGARATILAVLSALRAHGLIES